MINNLAELNYNQIFFRNFVIILNNFFKYRKMDKLMNIKNIYYYIFNVANNIT